MTDESASPRHIEEFQEALDAVIAIDPSLRDVVEQGTFHSFVVGTPLPTSFQYLVRSILAQQLSGLAAKAIQAKFEALYGGEFPTPAQVLETRAEDLRAAGLSWKKAEYVKGLAAAFSDCTLSDKKLTEAPDDEVVDMLVALKGIGPWSAQMFLLFYLRRMDVFSPGDLGVQRGFKHYIKRPGCEDIKATLSEHVEACDIKAPGTCKKALGRPPLAPDLRHMEAVASRFRPYRSALQMILWRLSDTVLAVDRETKPKTNSKTTNKAANGAAKAAQKTRDSHVLTLPASPSKRARRAA